MRQAVDAIEVRTKGRGLYDVTRELQAWVAAARIAEGLLTVFIQHTSASLVVQENADPDVLRDLDDFFGRLAPDEPRRYRHATEGADDMPSHIRAALTATQLAIPVRHGRLMLGTWQAVYVFEHRTSAFRRRLALHLIGDASEA
jgi:secondary thiamine-phosphate synthase enzyme